MGLGAASRLVQGRFDEKIVRETAAALRSELGREPTIGLVFASSDYIPFASDFLELLRLHAHIPILVGCSGQGLIGRGEELEDKSGFSLLLLSMPEAEVSVFPFDAAMIEAAQDGVYWRDAAGIDPEKVKAWLVFADPFQMPLESWVRTWNLAYPGVPAFGGIASSDPAGSETWLFHNDRIVEGGIALALSGKIEVHAVVSQGCKPIGEPLTVTQAERNVLFKLGSKPAYEVLNGAFQGLTAEEKDRARGHLLAGLALNEYVDDYKRGDFLVRNILGADPQTGAVAINAKLRVGQTVQYQLRDATAASEELHTLMEAQKASLGNRVPVAGLLCSCNGRGITLFKQPNHDVSTVGRFFPGLPLAGFFANGEIGPVGTRNFVHSYTASLALFCDPATP